MILIDSAQKLDVSVHQFFSVTADLTMYSLLHNRVS